MLIGTATINNTNEHFVINNINGANLRQILAADINILLDVYNLYKRI